MSERPAIYPKKIGVKVRIGNKNIGVIHYYKGEKEPWIWRKLRYRKIWGETGCLKDAFRELCVASDVNIDLDTEEIMLNNINKWFLHYHAIIF